jgi:magnesium transporter
MQDADDSVAAAGAVPPGSAFPPGPPASPPRAPDGPVPPFRDEEGDVEPGFVALVADAIAGADAAGLKRLVADLHESDTGALIEALDPDERPRFVELLGTDFDFTALTEVDETIRAEILDELEDETVAQGVRDLDSDDAVYILEDLDEADKAAILDRLPAIERDALRRSLDYPEGSAGRRMQTEMIAVPPFWTVGQTIDFLRVSADLPETFYEIFVVDPGHRLLGHVALDRLLRTRRPVRIADIMADDRHRIEANEDLEDVSRVFQRYNLVSAAVVDDAQRLVGVLTIDDVVDVIEEEADEDLKALGGVKGDEELSDSVPDIARSRFGWLFINLLTAFFAAAVMSLFEASLEQMVALAVLAPIVASQGGNAATQTMTVAVRALATRELGAWNMSRFILREAGVGLINGAGFAAITGTLAAIWFASPGIGIVIGAAMIANLLAAALAGVTVPLVLDRWGADPAVSSGTFVTTVTDVVGFFAFLGIATWWFALG